MNNGIILTTLENQYLNNFQNQLFWVLAVNQQRMVPQNFIA